MEAELFKEGETAALMNTPTQPSRSACVTPPPPTHTHNITPALSPTYTARSPLFSRCHGVRAEQFELEETAGIINKPQNDQNTAAAAAAAAAPRNHLCPPVSVPYFTLADIQVALKQSRLDQRRLLPA